ncbi:glycoside hydrolase family 43 protein [Microbacterium halophytorum]|uniref:glycoside hydrolase family 43 protein n=1 Tax=Microbacterium halophytorum TaxID=2067568 RepID=UPI000CFCC3F1|nr:glycoside hydrolase family 43 protein [Microbacterium halophytorum]
MSTQPILAGFHPDPSICRVGGDYFLLNSSFEYVPGLPIHRSRDLKTWDLVGHAVPDAAVIAAQEGAAGASAGLYGPSLRHHGGLFWATTTSLGRFRDGILITHAERPEGPWSDPVFVPGTMGIDPDLAWDDTGTCILTWRSMRPGGISQVDIDPLTGERLGDARLVWPDDDGAETEGPHLVRRGERWYLFTAQGGTHTGHGVSVARARHPRGPFETHPHNPVLTHRGTGHPVQATGHADVVELADGSWAMVFLGIRQQGSFPRSHVLGRETFLAGLDWEDDWPVVVEERFPEASAPTGFADDFDRMDARWVSPSVRAAAFASAASGLTLSSGRTADAAEQTRVLCTRVTAHEWDAAAMLADGDGALSVRIDATHWYAIEAVGDRIRARIVSHPFDQVLGEADRPVTANLAIRARLIPRTQRGNRGPDIVSLGFIANGEFTSLADVDGRYLSTELAGGFTGRMLGLEALGGPARFSRGEFTVR